MKQISSVYFCILVHLATRSFCEDWGYYVQMWMQCVGTFSTYHWQ